MNNIPFKVLHNISLASLSTFAIGGLAKNYIPVASGRDFITVLNYLHKKNIPFQVFSGGSNVVFPDRGFDKHLIHVKDGDLSFKKNIIIADCGVPLSKVIKMSIEKRLSGLENLSGIPGSIGGAVVGNAGAYGVSISQVVNKIEIWHDGKIKWLSQSECDFSYRESIFKKNPFYILRVEMFLKKSDAQKLHKISDEIIRVRKQKYKKGLKCPGSFFKNVLVTDVSPQSLSKINQSVIIGGKIPAGFLLTEVRARGMKVGSIQVSDFHGNLLINNKGNGTAKDVRKLADILKEKVFKKFGIMLEEEVRYL